MTVKIRLSRGGKKNHPFYRVVVADVRSPRDGRFIDCIGHYDPLLPKNNSERLFVKQDRLQHWIGVGALPTDTVVRLFKSVVDFKIKPKIYKKNPAKEVVSENTDGK